MLEVGTRGYQIVNQLHLPPMNVIGWAPESARSQLEGEGQPLEHPTTRRSVQVRLAFGVLALRVEGKRDQDQNRCPGDLVLSFARYRRPRRRAHAPTQRSHWPRNRVPVSSRRSKLVRMRLALSLLSTRIRSSNRLRKLNQPAAPPLIQFDR